MDLIASKIRILCQNSVNNNLGVFYDINIYEGIQKITSNVGTAPIGAKKPESSGKLNDVP